MVRMFGNIGPFLLLTDNKTNLISSVISSTSKFSARKATIFLFRTILCQSDHCGNACDMWGDGGQANFYRCWIRSFLFFGLCFRDKQTNEQQKWLRKIFYQLHLFWSQTVLVWACLHHSGLLGNKVWALPLMAPSFSLLFFLSHGCHAVVRVKVG